MFCKNLCEKVSKIKNWRCTFYSFFRALCRGVLCFCCRCIFHGENRETKSPVLTFLKKAEKRRKVRAETGRKNRETLFFVTSIFDSRPSRSFWTPKLLSQPFLKCRNGANIIVEETKIRKFLQLSDRSKRSQLIPQIYTRSKGRTKILGASMSKSSDRASKRTPPFNSSVGGRARNKTEHMGKKRNFGIFHFFQKNEIFRKCFPKISVTKFR